MQEVFSSKNPKLDFRGRGKPAQLIHSIGADVTRADVSAGANVIASPAPFTNEAGKNSPAGLECDGTQNHFVSG
jgi:hypothetical protein